MATQHAYEHEREVAEKLFPQVGAYPRGL